jgi:hypothetical protein
VTSALQRAADLATWMGGQFKSLRGYVDQQVVAARAYTDSSLTTATSGLTSSLQGYADNKAAQVKADILGGASAAYDTLKELQDAITGDQGPVAALTAKLGTRVAVDAQQSFTNAQQAVGRANIAAAAAADLGTDVDLVALAVAALNS